ncbi:MAG: N-formylglutamate amidohydrolase [Chitinispirillia bacterium]|jgi:formiminoglutamase
MVKLPVFISIPHGGEDIPEELISRTRLTQNDIIEDGDAFTREIYSFGDNVLASLNTNIARAFIDLNRSPDDLAPINPDGVIKTLTTMGKLIYREGQFPDNTLISSLLWKYYFPYHQKLEKLSNDKRIRLALDCHSMLDKSPPVSSRPNVKRPLFCLSNLGNSADKDFNTERNVTCSFDWMHRLAECFMVEFNIDKNDIRINDPFKGGYIIQLHGKNSIPWIQIEINRKLYLVNQDSADSKIKKSGKNIRYIQSKLLSVLKSFFSHV